MARHKPLDKPLKAFLFERMVESDFKLVAEDTYEDPGGHIVRREFMLEYYVVDWFYGLDINEQNELKKEFSLN